LQELRLPSTGVSGGLVFHDRSPSDRPRPIDWFHVHVTDHDLSAAGKVHAGYDSSHPASLFANMARQWAGWAGELAWQSTHGELAIRCSADRLGHIAIRVELSSGGMPDDWQVAGYPP